MHYFYVIYSKSLDRYYVGESPNIENRLEQHNSHYFKKGFTKAASDWKIVLSKQCPSKKDAVYLERFVKRMKSKKFVLKVIRSYKIENIIGQIATKYHRPARFENL